MSVDADLHGLHTVGCVFSGCDFTLADLGASRHRGTAFRSCTPRRASLAEAVLEGCSLLLVDL